MVAAVQLHDEHGIADKNAIQGGLCPSIRGDVSPGALRPSARHQQGVLRQIGINHLHLSHVAGVVEGTGLNGNIEFWNTNYNGNQTGLIPGGTNAFDYDDTRDGSGNYGSMQIHNFDAQQTILAYNRWNDGSVSDLGIGNQPTGNPDWTFAADQQPVGADDYTLKNLYVLVEGFPSSAAVPEPSTFALAAPGLLGLAFVTRRRKR